MIIDIGHYRDGVRQHQDALSLEHAGRCRAEGEGFVWIGLEEPSAEEMGEAQRIFELDDLAVEDAQSFHQRPKIEDYPSVWFVVLRTARYDDEREEVDFGEVHLFLGSGYVITVRHGEASRLRGARERLEARSDLLMHGPISVLWAVLDQIVDDYEPVVEGLEHDIAEVEQSVFGKASSDPTERIYLLRRELGEFYRSVHPLLAPLDGIEKGAWEQAEPMRRFFRDVNDHVKLVHEELGGQREQLREVLDANMALLSHRQNEVVRAISGWGAIITVPTLIASVYGMNFDRMPELKWAAGYPFAIGLMLFTALMLYGFLKRARWL
ncbi:MAG: magnesium and cobalt transport protein CorA [Solirubrobacteraceae bacterium]